MFRRNCSSHSTQQEFYLDSDACFIFISYIIIINNNINNKSFFIFIIFIIFIIIIFIFIIFFIFFIFIII